MTCANASPPGGVTGVPREIVSVKPFTRNSVPSVVTNDGTRSTTVTTPFTTPTRPAASSPSSSARTTGMPGFVGEMHDERRQREHHAGGKIDLAADHQHDLAARDDRRRRDELRQVLQARAGQQEVAVGRLEPGDQQHRHHQDAGLLPAHEQAQRALAARIGSDALIGPERCTICALSDLPS